MAAFSKNNSGKAEVDFTLHDMGIVYASFPYKRSERVFLHPNQKLFIKKVVKIASQNSSTLKRTPGFSSWSHAIDLTTVVGGSSSGS